MDLAYWSPTIRLLFIPLTQARLGPASWTLSGALSDGNRNQGTHHGARRDGGSTCQIKIGGAYLEDVVKRYTRKLLPLCLVLLSLGVRDVAVAQQPPPEHPPADVAGRWTIHSKGPTGVNATKFIELKQEGSTITGHFKGPYQSGGLEGTVNQQHIVFRTKTREPLVFRGRVEG
ncbi:MAG TPA: hypothetical protein VI455_20405, partial [Terriglobia bacterium]